MRSMYVVNPDSRMGALETFPEDGLTRTRQIRTMTLFAMRRRMHSELKQFHVSTDDGVATVCLNPLGDTGSSFTRHALRALESVVETLAATPSLEIVVFQSGTQHVSTGYDPAELNALETDSDAVEFARTGQRVFAKLSAAPFVSLMVLEGASIGPALELALACDYRLAVSGPDTWLGFGDVPTCWGGQTRLAELRGQSLARRLAIETITAKEAKQLGVVDHVCCTRRTKIDLQTWQDQLQQKPHKRPMPWRAWFGNARVQFAQERRQFRRAVWEGLARRSEASVYASVNPISPVRSVGIVGSPQEFCEAVIRWAIRGVPVVWVGRDCVPSFAHVLRRGLLTPLEASQAAKRLHISDDAADVLECEFVIVQQSAAPLAVMLERELRPRAVLAVPLPHLARQSSQAARPSRILGYEWVGSGLRLTAHDATHPDTLAAAQLWLERIGMPTTVAQFEHRGSDGRITRRNEAFAGAPG